MPASQSLVFFCAPLIGGPKALADEAEDKFDAFIDKLSKSGTISSGGETTYWGDYTDEWAQINWFQWIDFENAERFVLSTNVSWESAHERPNNFASGCGIIFNEGSGAGNYLMASLRMDGLIYFTGKRNNYDLSYGTYRYGKASTRGSADFILVVDGDKASVYINGERVVTKASLPVMGDNVGICTLSGTNKDFGTRCTWNDIYMYKW